MSETAQTTRLTRLCAFKGFLWFVLGAAGVIAVLRFWHGLGATTALTDLTPWGFWIGFDVMGGVALAAGGFVVAATVHVFHLERYHAIVRPAVLTAFLGYLAVVGGLLFDLGLPWNIWHMIIYWNPHSPLFEVGWCVMLYTTVLGLEFAPVVLETAKHPVLLGVFRFLKKATIPIVVLGILLSTLHQSSLGSLFLIMPHRLHALWYTPILPILFFVSAVGLGLMMVATEALFTAYLYEREPEMDLLKGLGKAAAWVLWCYTALRLGDLAVRGRLAAVLEGSFESWLFVIEMLVAAIGPAVLLSVRKVRESPTGLRISMGAGVIGFVMNRLDVGGIAMIGATGTQYMPSWMEVAVSMGVVAAAALAYFFVAEHFHLFHAGRVDRESVRHVLPEFDPATGVARPDAWTFGLARCSLMLVFGAGAALALVPERAVSGVALRPAPVTPVGYSDRMVVDGNRGDLAVAFDHKAHVTREGGDRSCGRCHHLNRPTDQATGCAACHRDMEVATSIFDHDLHARRLDAGPGCAACHLRDDEPKDSAHGRPCLECHTRMVAEGARVRPRAAPRIGPAPGYRPAMHGLCIPCHEERARDVTLNQPALGQCATCHPGSGTPALDPMRPDERSHATEARK